MNAAEQMPLTPGGHRSSLQPMHVYSQDQAKEGQQKDIEKGLSQEETNQEKKKKQHKKPQDTSPQFRPVSSWERAQWWFLYPKQLGTHRDTAPADSGDVDIGYWEACCHMGHASTQPQTVNDFHRQRKAFARRMLAEFVGTAILIFVIGGLKVRASQAEQYTDALGATLGSGLCLSALIYCFGGVCGAHFNAAVTLAFVLRRSFPGRWLLPYWVAQFVGSLVGIGLIRSMFGHENSVFACNYAETHWTRLNTLWVEVLFSFMFIAVILMLSKKGGVAGADAALGVGFTLFWVLLFLAGIDGGGVNPFRSLGCAIENGPIDQVWPFVVGPMLGALAAAIFMWMQVGPLTERELQSTQGDGDD